MGPVYFLLEVLGFAVALCALHALRPRLGLAPLYFAIAFFQTMLFVADKGATPISVPLFGSVGFIGYSTYLPLLLCATVLVYVLEGSRAARQLLAAIVVLHVLHGVADELIAYHAHHPPAGTPWLGDSVLAEHSVFVRAASLGAFVVDFVVILVGYQALANRLPGLPLAVPVYLAMLLAMIADALAFSTLYGIQAHLGSRQLVEKLQVAAVASLPVAAYLHLHLSRHRGEVRRGILERGALDVFELHRRVQEVEAQLQVSERRYRAIEQAFRRYVSAEVVDTMLVDPSRLALGGEVREVTVLYVDIASYTTLAERLPPTEVIEVLNRYYDAVGRDVLAEGGMIMGMQGDSLLAAFGAPVDRRDHPDHAADALRAAERMLATVDALNDAWRRDGTLRRWTELDLGPLAIRIGVHAGPVVAGNIGSEERIEYTLIGDTVNLAARLEEMNKRFGTEVLITAGTRDRVTDPALQGRLEDLGVHQVRGRKEPVHVLTLRRAARASDADLPISCPAPRPPVA